MKLHSEFHYNGEAFTETDFVGFMQRRLAEGALWEMEHARFVLEWLNDDEEIAVSTSGSTGTPKVWHVRKQAMINSALLTAKYFNCNAGTRALLCLPSSYIAGKMMLVRAMHLGWHLYAIEPSSKPLSQAFQSIDFAAFTPMQLTAIGALEQQRLESIKNIIVGGASVSDALRMKLSACSNAIFETYGMAETLSHVALRKISAREEPFEALEGVSFSVDENMRLLIDAAHIQSETLPTQDVVELIDDRHFYYRGRFDQMINSGGVKLFPEAIERKLASVISEEYYITSEPDDTLGQRVVLYIESETVPDTEILQQQIASALSRFEIPKRIVIKSRFDRTASGKIIRK